MKLIAVHTAAGTFTSPVVDDTETLGATNDLFATYEPGTAGCFRFGSDEAGWLVVPLAQVVAVESYDDGVEAPAETVTYDDGVVGPAPDQAYVDLCDPAAEKRERFPVQEAVEPSEVIAARVANVTADRALAGLPTP